MIKEWIVSLIVEALDRHAMNQRIIAYKNRGTIPGEIEYLIEFNTAPRYIPDEG